jgi:hypothetical protein
MLSLKHLCFITYILLSGVAAAPLPTNELSVATVDKVLAVNYFKTKSRDLSDGTVVEIAAAEIRGTSDFAIESRDLIDASMFDVEVRKVNPKSTKKPKKPEPTKPKKPTTTKPKKPTIPKKPKSPKKPNTTDGAVCSIKKPGGLERREGDLRPAASAENIDEDMFVLAATGKVVVTNLSGCTALFLWDADNKPSVFHMFCGDEIKKSWQAIDEVGRKAVAFSIVASDKDRYKNTREEIVNYAENEGWPTLTEMLVEKEEFYEIDRSEATRLKLVATAGSRTIERIAYPNPTHANPLPNQLLVTSIQTCKHITYFAGSKIVGIIILYHQIQSKQAVPSYPLMSSRPHTPIIPRNTDLRRTSDRPHHILALQASLRLKYTMFTIIVQIMFGSACRVAHSISIQHIAVADFLHHIAVPCSFPDGLSAS